MNLFRTFCLFLSTPFWLCFACQNHSQEQGQSDSTAITDSVLIDSLSSDSDALVLSLTPTVDCLPFYYAHHSGIFKTLGLKVSLKTYASQFDCDTAMLGRTAIGGATDLVRLHYYATEGKHLSAVSSLDSQWRLLVSRKLRIKKMDLLKNRMIAIARYSASDYLCEDALRKSDITAEEVFNPQINDYYLRASMLNNNQIDAAILPEPFAAKARNAGHRILYSAEGDTPKLGCLVFKPSVLANPDSALMVTRILEGYNQAVAVLNEKGKTICKDILLVDFKMPKSVVDSISFPKYNKATTPAGSDVKQAQDFLEKHGLSSRDCKENGEYKMINVNVLPQ